MGCVGCVGCVGSVAGVHQRGGQVLQGGVFVGVNAQVTQAHLGQRGRHAGGPLNVHGLQVFVNATCHLTGIIRSRRGKAELGHAARSNAHFDAQARHRIESIDGAGICIFRPNLCHGGLRAAAVAAQKCAAVCDAVKRHNVGIRLSQKMRG